MISLEGIFLGALIGHFLCWYNREWKLQCRLDCVVDWWSIKNVISFLWHGFAVSESSLKQTYTYMSSLSEFSAFNILLIAICCSVKGCQK